MKELIIVVLTILIMQPLQSQPSNCLAPTPPMGWNSWNWHGKTAINETIIYETIDAIVENGLRDAGYEYIIIDGGWRDNKLGVNGELLCHPENFPNGIKVLADYAHANKLKFGLHIVPGTHDCGKDKVGGLGHEELHIQQLVDWEVDFVKLDKCVYTFEENPDFPPSDSRWREGWENEDTLENVYRKWGKLLKNSGRDIVFSISAYKFRSWYPEVCNMARTTPDIYARVSKGAIFEDSPRSLMGVAELNNESAEFAGNCYWNDPDMMSIGNQGLSHEEQKIHFALWCVMSSPLFLGNDPRNMSEDEKKLVLNSTAISINQDPYEQGKRVKKFGRSEVWKKQLSNNKQAILLFNRDNTLTSEIKINWEEMGISPGSSMYDVFENKEIKCAKNNKNTFQLPPRSCLFLLITQN